MMRKMTTAIVMILLAGVAVGQVKLKLPDTTAVSGSSLVLPIMVEDFKHIGSFSLIISFDKNVLTYTEVTGFPKYGVFNATPATVANNNGAVALSWFNVSPSINIQNGKLLDLHFTCKKGTSPLTFAKMVPSSVTDSLANNLPTTVKNGKVSVRTAQLDKKRVKPTAVVK
ncbi:MAG: cohesin domain-containing protein [Ignavibacteriales bacterium]|nr:cohesin domain-containing protein [Ignavibacteriales bacterium]